MKKALLILALATTFASCKRQSNTPSQSTQSSNSTTTNTPTSTTTVNDAVGKIKLCFAMNLLPFVTDVFDYKNDTANFRMYHNGTKITNVDITYDSNGNLTRVSDFMQLSPNPTKAIWLAHGDSLVAEFDHLEYNGGDLSHSPNQIHDTKLMIYQSQSTLPYYNAPSRVDFHAHNNTLTNADFIADQYLGQGNDNTTLALWKWNLGKKYRLVYIQP